MPGIGAAPPVPRGSERYGLSLFPPCTQPCICNESAPALSDRGEAKMTSKHITLAVAAVLFTAINLLVLAANWSVTAHAKIAGMDFSHLEVDTDFRRAVRDIVAEMDQSYWRRNSAFRGVVVDIVEGCQLSYRGSRNVRCHARTF